SPAPPKVRGIAPGSAADFRRREANRLAAERSRSRQHEKFAALEMAARVLGEENLRLKQEIARLEDEAEEEAEEEKGETHHEEMDDDNSPGVNVDVDVEAQVQEAIAASTSRSQETQQASHSRTILAALMSGAEMSSVDDAFRGAGEEAEASWMDGVEDLFKETESGRLGELAAVAAGAGGGERDSATPQPAAKEDSALVSTDQGARGHAMHSFAHVSMNTDMEALLKDDLATTLSRLEQLSHGEAGLDTQFPYSSDPETLQQRTRQVEEGISRLESEIEVLREVVLRMGDEKRGEETALASVVGEIQALGMDGGEKERERVAVVLKSIRGYIGAQLGGSAQDAITYPAAQLSTPFSSPSIARRRRGRPSKDAQPRPNNHWYRPSPDTALQSLEHGEDGEPEIESTPHPVPRRTRGKSGLSQQVLPPALPPASPPRQEDLEAIAATDEFILSHLTAHHDSSSFAAHFLHDPEHVDLEPHQPLRELEAQLHDADATPAASATPNVLSRLKQGPPGSCDICGRTETSVWRKLTLGGEDHKVCNACGLYHNKFGVIRPPELWGDGKSVKKRKAGTRLRNPGPDERNGKKARKDENGMEDHAEGHGPDMGLMAMGDFVGVDV
ncbi:hypothetical protein P7C73_g6669, partial [Tremellales sp. Uapishka_1]